MTYGSLPERIIQFGTGNFLRAFADWMIDLANEAGLIQSSIVVTQNINGNTFERLNRNHCQYSVVMEGLCDGEQKQEVRRITSISRCINPYENQEALFDVFRSADLEIIISNTTEAGIVYDPSDSEDEFLDAAFPGKLTMLLYERFKVFPDKSLLILPCELIENNGRELYSICLKYASQWGYEEDFISYLSDKVCFSSTLVDRIVSGYPAQSKVEQYDKLLGYHDELLVVSEFYNLWVIKDADGWKDLFPLHRLEKANVIWTENLEKYRTRKVRILNGSHTATAPIALLSGYQKVCDYINGSDISQFEYNLIQRDILPILQFDRDEIAEYAESIWDRFRNPYLEHDLLAMTLNGISKFRVRCLPTLFDCIQQHNRLPEYLLFAFAAFIRFYKIQEDDSGFTGETDSGEVYVVRDDRKNLCVMQSAWTNDNIPDVVHSVLSAAELWGNSALCNIAGLEEAIAIYLNEIETFGISRSLADFLAKEGLK